LLKEALRIDPDLVTIMLTGEGTIATAVEAMKLGAMDYVLKPVRLSELLLVVTRALEVRRLRLEKAELERRLGERTAELEVVNSDLKISNEELNAFAHSVSHDLRAPLRAVHSLANILAEDYSASLPSEAQGILNRLLANAERMGRMMEELLRFSQIGQCPLSKGEVKISELVRAVLDDLRPDQEGRAIEVRLGELPDFVGDAALLRQVLFNLISNAFKFTRGKQPAVVEIGCEEQNGATVYFVRDNGAGFDMEHAQQLFGVFQRLHGEQEFEGNGVGLSIVRRIIERHGGRIWADAMVGQGATFYFTLTS
jgi:light-regulated signal transduction histidine kinase (bacteriophytochrome)